MLGGIESVKQAAEEKDDEAEQEETFRGISADDFSYVLMVIKGVKLTEREIDVPKVEGATGVMKNVVLEEKGEDKKNFKFMIRKGGQAKIYSHFLSLSANRKGFEGKPKPKEDPELQEM